MTTIEQLRSAVDTDYFTDATLHNLFGSGPSRYGKVNRLVKKKQIIRLKNSFYIFSDLYCKKSIDQFHLANLLYGPSYVSLESALAYYGMIPEAVYGVVSVNTKRKHKLQTPIGLFEYRKITKNAFAAGVARAGSTHHFLIASREKAVLDKLYFDGPRIALLKYLLNNLRIDASELENLNLNVLLKLSLEYENKSFVNRVAKLSEEIGELKS